MRLRRNWLFSSDCFKTNTIWLPTINKQPPNCLRWARRQMIRPWRQWTLRPARYSPRHCSITTKPQCDGDAANLESEPLICTNRHLPCQLWPQRHAGMETIHPDKYEDERRLATMSGFS